MNVEFWFDYVSPWSYLAYRRLDEIRGDVAFRPMFLGGVMAATGNAPPAMVPAKGKYHYRDIMRHCSHYGIEFNFTPFFPSNTLRAMRGALVAQDEGIFDVYNETMWNAVWRDRQDVGDEDVLRSLWADAGLDADLLLERSLSPEIKERLKAATEEVVERGAFGAPTFFVGDEMFFGQDRVDFINRALES